MKKIKQYLPMILNIVILLVPFALICTWGYKSLSSTGDINGLFISLSAIIAFVFLVISLGIHIIIHEFGHLVTGLISGYKFGFFRIWKYAISFDEGKMKIKNFHIPGSLGQCVMAPPEKVNGDFPYLLYNLGGIIFNGLFSILSLVLVFVIPINLLSTFLLALGFVGLYLTFVNGYPFEHIPNDGTNIKSLKRSDDSKEAFYNALLLTKMYMDENPNKKAIKEIVKKENYQDFNEPLVQNVISENISLYIDDGELLKALEFSEFMLKQKNMTSILRNLILIDKASLHLLLGHTNEIEKLKNDTGFIKYVKSSGQGEIERYKYMYYTLHEKNEEKAKIALKNYKTLSADHLFGNHVDYDEKLISWTLEKIKWLDKLEVLDTVSSTNDYLKENLDSGNHPYDYVLAYIQTSGKGQGNHSFYSPEGGMYLSVSLRPKYKTSELKYLTGRAGVATVSAIKKSLGKKAYIKWINDIIYEDKKVGGILTESKLNANGEIEYIVIGIGLNLKKTGDIPEDISASYGHLGENAVEKATNSILYYLIPELQKLEYEVDLDIFIRNYNVSLYRKNQFVHVKRNKDIYEVILTGIDDNMDIITEMDGDIIKFSYNDSRIIDSI
ncbi:MAG: biotin--[acetyl-CoA-carboxylase] ligase [Tissierellia bacterium]|nr:biotin--[acetyl-CoA-carboxylase] ligase [Tissierellia bacterium]